MSPRPESKQFDLAETQKRAVRLRASEERKRPGFLVVPIPVRVAGSPLLLREPHFYAEAAAAMAGWLSASLT